MSFSKMFEILKIKENEKIVFVQCGAFYIAIGEDAVLLHEILELKCTCFQKQVCKVGIPIGAIKKYTEKLKELGYTYVVYEFDKKKKELKVVDCSQGKYHYLEEKTINCLWCKGISMYKDDEYIEAVTKLLEIEDENKLQREEDTERGRSS